MKNDYPGMLQEETEWRQFWPSTTIYSPIMDKMIYLKNGEAGFKIGDVTLSLLNLKSREVISEIKHFGWTPVYPKWKSNASGLVYVKSVPGINPTIREDELYFLSSSGETRRLTKLSEHFKNASIDIDSLSPDENFLAFTLTTSQDMDENPQKWPSRLMVLDLNSLQLTNYCFSPGKFTSLVWSPDGQQLAFSEIINGNDHNYRTVVIDFTNKKSFAVGDQFTPEGWLISEKQ